MTGLVVLNINRSELVILNINAQLNELLLPMKHFLEIKCGFKDIQRTNTFEAFVEPITDLHHQQISNIKQS